MAQNSMPVQASGYKSIWDTPLAKGVKFAGTIIDRNWEESFISRIANTSILQDLTKCAQMIQFKKPPQAGPWRPYELNQTLITDQPTQDRFCITICGSAYKSLKIDKEDIRRACDDWPEFEQGFLDDSWRQFENLLHYSLLDRMQLSVGSRNLGARAGRDGNINLGTLTSALHLSPDNILNFFTRMKMVLQQAGRWYEGEMFMVVPEEMSVLLLETMFAKQLCCNMSESLLFKGLVATNILGFTIIESQRLRPTIDRQTNRLVYPILAGWSEAYAFTADIVDADLVEMERSFGVLYKMLGVYGGGVIYPEALTKAYVTFSTAGLVPSP